MKRQSVPTETNSSYTPTGDDSTGPLWTYAKYDWMGRVVRKINTDGTDSPTINDSDVLISYEGCGCAGGLETTVQGPLVPRDDQPTVNARRTQKSFADILGRQWKAVSYKWDGTTAYTTTEQFFNGRDQVIKIKQTDNTSTASPQTHQDVTMTFDGHGRLKTEHIPQQDAATATVYDYNADDSIQSIIDARGATTNYTYDDPRGLVTQISYTSPNSTTIPVAPTVDFTYDNMGNRTQMTDGLGTQTYEYNSLSQITAETRSFTDNIAGSPLPNNSFRLEYVYTLSGDLRSLTDPYGEVINYTLDKDGRLGTVTGTPSGGATKTYASNPEYNARGQLKHLEYGNGTQMNMTFNDRLQPDHYELNGSGSNPDIMNKNYEYYADGSLRYVEDTLNPIYDRLMSYDQESRPVTGLTGLEARGGTVSNQTDQETSLPYRQSFQFNAFNNLTQRNNLLWGTAFNSTTTTYQNDRIVGGTYDADGRQLDGGYTYNAAGQPLGATSGTLQPTATYDGDGQLGKRRIQGHINLCTDGPGATIDHSFYYIRSTVLGGKVVSEAWTYGNIKFSYVHAAGAVIARYGEYQHTDASGMSFKATTQTATVVPDTSALVFFPNGSPLERDTLGGNVGTMKPAAGFPIFCDVPGPGGNPSWVDGEAIAMVDGFVMRLAEAQSLLRIGAAVECPYGSCGPRRTENGVETFHANADGYAGYSPIGSYYAGGGSWTWQTQAERTMRSKPTLKYSGKRSKAEVAHKRALANTGVFDNEASNDDWRPPEFTDLNRLLPFLQRVVDLVSTRVRFVDLNADQRGKIIDGLTRILALRSCYDAFRKWVPTQPVPAEVIRDRGIVFGSFNSLKYADFNEKLGISNPQREEANSMLSVYSHGRTVTKWEGLPVYIFLPEKLFKGEGDYTITEGVIHENIHGVGVGDNSFYPLGFGFKYGHDLYGMDGYDEIVKACQ